MLRKLVFVLLTFTAPLALPEEFIIKHHSCKLFGLIKERTSNPDLYEVLEQQLQIKNFGMSYVTSEHKFKKGDLILSMEKEFLGGFFPPCLIVIHITQEGFEKKFFSAGTKRSYPRHLGAKNYLCRLAIRDVLLNLPYCQKTQSLPKD